MSVAFFNRKPGETIGGWWLAATCPACAGQLVHVADGIPSGVRSRTIARCPDCGRTWAVQASITDVSTELGRRRTKPAPMATGRTHGLISTYNAGCRCDDCRDASATHRRQARARERGAA